MLIKIDVTEKHIKEGNRNQCTTCPVALAINDRLIPKHYANVGFTGFTIQNITQEMFNGFMPYEASRFIQDFDSKQHVEPFSFEINIPKVFLKDNPNA